MKQIVQVLSFLLIALVFLSASGCSDSSSKVIENMRKDGIAHLDTAKKVSFEESLFELSRKDSDNETSELPNDKEQIDWIKNNSVIVRVTIPSIGDVDFIALSTQPPAGKLGDAKSGTISLFKPLSYALRNAYDSQDIEVSNYLPVPNEFKN